MEYIEAPNTKIRNPQRMPSAHGFVRASGGFCAVRALRIE
jgi:hypothetical protein